MRLTHYTRIAWELLTRMAEEDRNLGSAGRYTREMLLGKRNCSSTLSDDLLKLLCAGGILSSQRGTNGGYVLCHAPGEVTLLKVAAAVELAGPITDPSSTFYPIERHIKRALARVNLADSLPSLEDGDDSNVTLANPALR
jgi:DNA-binding IscR family transcriptional regulator